jgi:xanthine/uracil permease
MLAGCVVAPITIGEAFQLSQVEIIHFVQRALFVMGIVSILQSLFGHQLPIIEAPAAVWWGIFLLFAGLATSPEEGSDILQMLLVGVLISGILFVLLSLTGIIKYVRNLCFACSSNERTVYKRNIRNWVSISHAGMENGCCRCDHDDLCGSYGEEPCK